MVNNNDGRLDFGFHRSIMPVDAIPQSAEKVDSSPEINDHEIRVTPQILNLDSTSMREIAEGAKAGKYPSIEKRIMEIIASRGKMHNPITNSGGVLIGIVDDYGTDSGFKLAKGQVVIPVTSLSTIPLAIDGISKVRGDMVDVTGGSAILFKRTPYSALPEGYSLEAALAAIDVSSIVPQVYRNVNPGQKVLFIGTGKASLAAMAAIRDSCRDNFIAGIDYDDGQLSRAERLGFADLLAQVDAREPYQVMKFASSYQLFDVVVNCVNMPGTEASSILACKDHGLVLYFSMATRFDKAALGTDATGKDVTMVIGNGVAKGQAGMMFRLLDKNPALKGYFSSH